MAWLEGYPGRYRLRCAPGTIHKFIMHKGRGPERTINDCYLGDHFKDLNDLHFTGPDGVTPFFDYWVELVDGDRAVVWIKFTAGTVYIYPGADPAAAAQNQVPPA